MRRIDHTVEGTEFVELADAIGALRAQLLDAHEAARKDGPTFEISKVSVELSVDATKGSEGDFGFRFGVFSAEARERHTSGSTHTVTLELTPTPRGGGIPAVTYEVENLRLNDGSPAQ